MTALLEEHFPDLVDTSFTARMENTLDEISHGKVQWLPYLEGFYKAMRASNPRCINGKVISIRGHRAPLISRVSCVVRIGRFGAYLEAKRVGDDGEEELIKATLPREITPADLDQEQAELILKQKADGPEALGEDPETGDLVYLLFGQYGPYVQRGQVSDDNLKLQACFAAEGRQARGSQP